MKTPDDQKPLSDEAKNVDNRARDLISDLTKFDVRKRKSSGYKVWWSLLLTVAIFIIFLLILHPDLFTNQSETPNAPNTTQAAVPEDAGVGEALDDRTWTMYRTDANGDEGYVATIRFVGEGEGTTSLSDDGHFGGAFQQEGDQVSFKFIRTFDTAHGDFPEHNRFEGTLTGPNEITGVWERQDWECTPSADKCDYHDEWIPNQSRLVRKP